MDRQADTDCIGNKVTLAWIQLNSASTLSSLNTQQCSKTSNSNTRPGIRPDHSQVLL